jgi:endonuclease-3
MPRESFLEKKTRTAKITAELRRAYPDAHCELDFANPFQLLIATILSAQSTDKQVNLVTADLFKKYPTPQAIAQLDQATLEREIQRLGFFRNKARSIRGCSQKLVERHGGQVPRTMEELIQLDGVGRKTANVVLGNAFGIECGVVVDTHVTRLSDRLALSRQPTAEKIELDLMKLVPRQEWTLFSHLLIWHGRRRCFARNPDCPHCEVNTLCPSAGRVGAKGRG